MLQLLTFIQARLAAVQNDERGATAVEYGLVVSLIAIALIATFTGLKNQISALYTEIGNAL